jgi:hypothetical protein
MTQINEILFLGSLVLPAVFVWLFERHIVAWTFETNPKKRESESRKWHTFKFWALAIPPLALFYFSGLTQWFKYLPGMMWIAWVGFDMFWNWRHKIVIGSKWLFYPGDGKGGLIEISVFWLSKLIRVNFAITFIVIKLIVLGFSIFIIIKFK